MPTHKPSTFTLGQLRCLATQLYEHHRDYAVVARIMDITPIRARDLCIQHRRFLAAGQTHSVGYELSARAILALVTSDRAAQYGTSFDERLPHFDRIARSFSRKSRAVAAEWLAKLGREGRAPATLDKTTWLLELAYPV